MLDAKKQVKVRDVRRDADDRLYYVVRKNVLGSWIRENHSGFKHSTSAWAYLGKLTVAEK